MEDPIGRRDLFLTYWRLKLKQIIRHSFIQSTNKKLTTKIFDYDIRFFSYSTLIFLFEEIFIHRNYHFSSDSRQPFILDCGSNIGLATLFFKKLFPQAKIIAFEPDPNTFERLRENIENNALTDVILVNKAIHKAEGTIDFYSDPENPGSLVMSTMKERISKAKQTIGTVLLSSYIEGNVDFVKMDIEGAETLVLEELVSQNKLRMIDQMLIEYHHHIKKDQDSLTRILSILECNSFGYQLSTQSDIPFQREQFQDILIYAYRR